MYTFHFFEIFMKIEEGQRENFIKFADFTWNDPIGYIYIMLVIIIYKYV